MVINSLTIIYIVAAVIALIATFRWGQNLGYEAGYIDGRVAVREYYEAQK